MLPQAEIYVWQRVWTREVADAVQSDADFVARWHILVAQAPANLPLRRFAPNWAAIARSGRPATPVIRIDGQLDPATSPALARDIADLFRATPAATHDRIEIDHDCATARLASYAAFLTSLRGALPPRTAIDIQAFGDTRPLVPTAAGVREPQNRRVAIILR